MRSNQAVARVLYDIADAMEVLDENRFRLAAYRRAGDTVAGLSTSLEEARRAGGLTDLPAIGEGMAAIISELLDTGASTMHEALLTRVPPGLLEMLRLPEIGPKSAARLYHEAGITTMEQLREAASEGRLRAVKGFGAKTEARILEAIARFQTRSGRLRLGDALPIAHELVAALRNAAEIEHLVLAGSLRRGDSTVRNLDLVAASADPAAVIAAFLALPQVAAAGGGTPAGGSATVTLHNGFQAELRAVAPERWGTALQFLTGSREHHALLAPLAAGRTLAFGPDGLRRADGTVLDFADEEQVYAALGLPWIPPELRNGWDEIERALAGGLPRLIEQAELRADLHWHTDWSDGRAPLRAMAEAGRLLGYSHMSVADHSAYLGVTNGLDAGRLRAQRAELDALNAEFAAQGLDFRLLQGCEVDILPDGSLALPDEVLAELDVVIASPHAGLRQPRAESTARLIRAISNPHVDLIGHPTGRLINERDGADLDMEAVLDAAAATGTALEINASPERLDLDAPLAHQALRRGIRLSINTDAHAPSHLAAVGLGVLTARRSGARADDVINTWSHEQLTDWLRSHKS